MIENIRLSFQGIWAHKMRSFLTMLGIIIGIASIISIVSTIKGTNEQIKRNLIGAGNNVVRVQLYQNDTDWVYEVTSYGMPQGIPQVDEDTYQEILDMPQVEDAAVYTRRMDYNNSLYYGNEGIDGCEMLGVDNSYFETCQYVVDRGRMFVPADFNEYRPVAIIDNNTAEQLFQGEDPVGKTIEYNSTALVVVGVVEVANRFEPVINSIEDYYTYMGNSTSGKVFIPNAIWPSLFAYDEPQEVAVRCQSTEAMSTVGTQVADLLNENNQNETIRYRAEDVLQQAQELQELSNATNQQLVWIASISLLVGGIGVMNIMLVSITERTREIGIRKALGASNGAIRTQFIVESVVICLVGGALGILVGFGLGSLGASLIGAPARADLGTVLVAVGFSMGIGVFFGYYPANKAAKLDPIEALRYE